MSQEFHMTTEKVIENIENDFNEAKNKCSELYKKIDESKVNNNIDQYIDYYRSIIKCLNDIKEESLALDNVPLPLICFKSDEEIYEERKKNCDIILAMAQHIRGCKQSFEKYNQQIKSEKK